LGVHSFLDETVKVSSQFIAEGLANRGWQVDYISIASSLFDMLSNHRRKRFARVWFRRQDKIGIAIKPGLTEFAFRTLHPARKLFLRTQSQLNGYAMFAPIWLKNKHYDICIHDITTNFLFLPMISSDFRVLRLNDPPEGFAFDLHQTLIDRFKQHIASSIYDDIWAVSYPLARYAQELNPKNNIVVLPNGIEYRFWADQKNNNRCPKTAVYIGSIAPWVDLDLLEQTARHMPDWQFDIFGPSAGSWTSHTKNVQRFSPVGRKSVPRLLSHYQVGLIPFKETSERLKYVEKPLKFYEYIGCGLGIASTDFGALKMGMGGLAAYGNTPQEFAAAIIKAAKDGEKRSDAFNKAFIKAHSWDSILEKIDARISTLLRPRAKITSYL
jgi:glycosyltransferase involved in cell wall biosynthesis